MKYKNSPTSANTVYAVRSLSRDLTHICLRYATANIAYTRTLDDKFWIDTMEKIIGSGLIFKNGSFLLVNAKVGAAKDFWNNPGGHKEEYETIEECAAREVKEETGFDVKISRLIGTYSRRAKKYVYECEIIGGDLDLPIDEIADAKWFTIDQIRQLANITFGAKQSALDFLNGCFNQEYHTAEIP